MLQAFCHKGNEGKPKRHKKAKSDLKPIKTEDFAGFVHSTREVNWWSGLEERKKHKKPAKRVNIPSCRLFAGEASWWSSKKERQTQEWNRLELQSRRCRFHQLWREQSEKIGVFAAGGTWRRDESPTTSLDADRPKKLGGRVKADPVGRRKGMKNRGVWRLPAEQPGVAEVWRLGTTIKKRGICWRCVWCRRSKLVERQ